MTARYPTTIPQQLHALHAALHLSHTPSAMPCRSSQQESIRSFLLAHVSEHVGGSLYLSGSPGTGKTASVEHVISQMYGQRILDGFDASTVDPSSSSSLPSSAAKSVRPSKLLAKLNGSSATGGDDRPSTAAASSGPRIIYTNAMAFSRSPRSLYPRLLAQVQGLSVEAEAALEPMAALETLKTIFCGTESSTASSASKKKKSAASVAGGADRTRMTLVVLDEVDALLSGSSPGVLYSLLEWPLTVGSRLVVISISNSINLLEQKLPHLNARNALPRSLVFSTYSRDELKQIVQERCESIYPTEEEEKLATEKVNESKDAADSSERTTSVVKMSAKSPAKGQLQSPAKSPAKAASPSADDVSASPAPASVSASKTRGSRSKVSSAPPPPPPSGRISRSAAARAAAATRDEADSSAAASTPVIPSPAPLSASSSIAELGRELRAQRGRKRKHEEVAAVSRPPPTEASAQPVALTVAVAEETSQAQEESQEAIISAASGAPVLASSLSDAPNPLLVTPKKKSKPSPLDSPLSSPLSPMASPPPLDFSTLAPLSTRATPFFEPFALDLLCAKVAKGSGDLRKVLEVMRRAVDALLVEWEGRYMLARERARTPVTATAAVPAPDTPAGAEDRSDGAPSPSPFPLVDSVPSPLQVSVPLLHELTLSCLGSAGDQGVLLRSLPSQQKIVLVIAGLLCHLQGGRDILQGFATHYARFSREFTLPPLRGHELSDLLAALAAHRLLKLVPKKRARVPTGSGASAGGSGGGSKMKSKLGSGGGGSGSGVGRGLASGGGSSALGSIQVNVTLESLQAAFEEDEAVSRLLARGKALATAILAAAKQAAAPVHADYVMRDIEE